MKKSTEFVLQLLLAIVEPLITLLGSVIDSHEKNDDEPRKNDDNDQA
ncbi:MAG: hypothetical protein HUK01_08990 [Bacteroidaceae bacterium]|nr:hypothetical protein [Bacteroidaceae bacterium]